MPMRNWATARETEIHTITCRLLAFKHQLHAAERHLCQACVASSAEVQKHFLKLREGFGAMEDKTISDRLFQFHKNWPQPCRQREVRRSYTPKPSAEHADGEPQNICVK